MNGKKVKEKGWLRLFLLFMLGIGIHSNLFSQSQGNHTINGNIKDAYGEAIIGASVLEKGTTNGTISDFDGNFTLSTSGSAILSISYIGYITQEIPVDNKTSFQITLNEDVEALEEVVVVGYATGSKRTISGAVERVKKEDMNVGIVNNPLESIRGKVAGVVISKTGGDPAAGPSIRVRGTTSLSGGNDPLVIIDGVFGDLGLLNALSPQDIETFTILKDASETAQYGSRGASGVIVVTTAKGKAGVVSLSYDGTFGVETVYKNIEMMDAAGYRSAVEAGGYGNALDLGANTNFIEEMQRTGFTQNHRVSFGAGNEQSNYRASVGVIANEGVIKGSDMKNYTTKLDASQKMFDDKMKIEFGIFGSKKINHYVNDHQKTFYSAASFNPTFPIGQNADGTWPEDPNANEIDNPLGRLTIQDKEENAYINVHGKISYNFTDDLMLSAFGSYTFNDKNNSVYTPNNVKAGIREGGGKALQKEEKSNILMGNITLTYKKEFDKHHFDALGLMEGQKYEYNGFEANARGFGTNYFGFNNLKAGANVKYGDVSSYANSYNIASFMARLNYMFDNRYIATVNLRTDASSKLGDNNKWGFFPSASAAWVVSNEGFLKDVDQITNIKLRVGYGLTGNQDAISPYNSLSLMQPTGITTVNGQQTVTYGYARNANPDLKWEKKKMFDVGVDFGLFENRLSGSVDYYVSRTTGLLYEYAVPVPPFLYDKLLANLGEMGNDGVEVALNFDAIRSKDIDLKIGVNGSYQKNEIRSLSGIYMGQDLSTSEYMRLVSINGAGFIGGNTGVTYQMVGQPLGVFYLPHSRGLINDGLGSYTYQVEDLDKDGTVDINDGNDRYIAGQAMPKVYLGANINFRYKRFDVQLQMNGAFGHKIYNGTSLTYMNMNTFPTYNVLPDAPAMNIKDNTVTDYWLEKGDYLNLDYVSFGYNFDVKNWGKTIKNIRLTASVNNLHTFTNYSGLSPMINSSVNKKDGNDLGVDDKRFYPLSRTYSLGLNITF